jgi:uncharacterized Zn-binding protein involved in type VI secretion
MTGVAVKGKDKAGGAQKEQANLHFRINGDPVVTIGDTVEPHGDHAPAAVMVEGEVRFRIGGRPVCRAEHKASCGHATTGRQRFRIVPAQSQYRPYLLPSWLPCNVEHIPWIMRAHGWHLGAMLMDKWFTGLASTNKDQTKPDFSSVTMDFVLGFPDAKRKYDDLVNPSLWSHEVNGDSTVRRLCRRLAKDALLTNQRMTFDYLSLPKNSTVRDLKGLQIDNARVRPEEEGKPPLDGLTAALGAFEFLLVVSGEVEPMLDGRYRIEVNRTGVFLEDQYDFATLWQGLGFWSIDDHYVSNEFDSDRPFTCPATNLQFQEWRVLTGRGRDYWIYSDLKVENVSPPAVFYCPA